MIILQITQLKNFMNTLLRLETFDRFPVSEALITTFTTFSIDGSLHTDFFDPDDAQLLKEKGRTRLLWKDVKSFCYSVIKGKRTPLQFKFVFQLPQAACEKMIADHALPLEIENVFGCFLNFQYKDGKLLLTTGTSLKIFTMDKSLDRVFDEEVRQFLLKNEIAFEEQRYWDISRWRIAEEIFKNPLEGLEIRVKGNTTSFNEVDVLSTTFDVKRYLYPIPYNEVVKNDNMIQNPKW